MLLGGYSTGCTRSGLTLALAGEGCRRPLQGGPPEDSGYQLGGLVIGQKDVKKP